MSTPCDSYLGKIVSDQVAIARLLDMNSTWFVGNLMMFVR
jgi:hypothetical protein